MKLINPHGGTLVNREVKGRERDQLMRRATTMPKLQLNARQISDVLMIATGAYSPIEGFMGEADYNAVVSSMRLANGVAWPIPITMAVSTGDARRLQTGQDVALYQDHLLLGVLHLGEKYTYHKAREAESVYRTTDLLHPGVQAIHNQGDWLLGGCISLINRPDGLSFVEYRKDPEETRTMFKDRGWRRIVAFQTRNPVHRAHEYIQKCAMEIADGLLLHPLVGETKSDDVPAEVRMRSYEKILANYYPVSRTVLAVMPAAMRYAGPREAVFHALIRKNYGCSHFIVGRDHAGVGNYYGTYDAHHIFDEFEPHELGITPLFFDHTFYCKACGAMASTKTCPHDQSEHVTLSGTKVRELLNAGQLPPVEFSRPEVAQVLIEAYAATRTVARVI
ncbi:MAG TPA: sulfate adenylyltransferase [Pyrinomonadaceae bacterium]|jgi:sulfate adenylyltransferase|nr:sulfate adenylyltransferase [Pyrinomonadaceae bacterium]